MNERAEQSFGPNKFTLAVTVSFALFTQWMFYLFRDDSGPTTHAVNLVVMASLLGLIVWLASIKVTLDSEGICYHSLFSRKEMRWDEIERYYCSVTLDQRSFSLKLVDERGQKLSLGGNRVEGPMLLAQAVVERTYDPLLRKLSIRLHQGEDLDFGPIRLGREKGIRALYRKNVPGLGRMPWKSTLKIECPHGFGWGWEWNGQWFSLCDEEKNRISIPQSQVANANVLGPLAMWLWRMRSAKVDSPHVHGVGPVQAFSLLSPEHVARHGLSAKAIIGWAPRDTEVSAESFQPNPEFVSFLHEVIVKHAPLLCDKEEVKRRGQGHLCIWDYRAPNPKAADTEDVVGHFEIRAGELIPESYCANPDYLLLSQRGFFQLGQGFHERMLPTPCRWKISAGFLSTFSSHKWDTGYGGWSLFFDPRIVGGVIELVGRYTDDVSARDRYNGILSFLMSNGAYEPCEPVFPD